VAKPERAERCDECRHWESGRQGVIGECRRNAPTIIENQVRRLEDVEIHMASVFPYTSYDCWCGEFIPAGASGATGGVATTRMQVLGVLDVANLLNTTPNRVRALTRDGLLAYLDMPAGEL
jgi:hypothetical protein